MNPHIIKVIVGLLSIAVYCGFVAAFYSFAYEKLGGDRNPWYGFFRLIICLVVAGFIGYLSSELIKSLI